MSVSVKSAYTLIHLNLKSKAKIPCTPNKQYEIQELDLRSCHTYRLFSIASLYTNLNE